MTQITPEYLSSLSHDIRSPLGRIIGYADLMLKDDADKFEGERNQFLEQIRKDAYLILEQLTDLSRRLSADEQNTES